MLGRVIKAKFQQLSRKLQRVHRLVLENERIAAEIRLGRDISALDFFNLLTQDPTFAWVQPLAALIAEIDEHVDEAEKESRELREEDLAAFRAKIEYTLLDPKSSVRDRYLQYLSQDTDLVIAHAELRADLGSAPKTQLN